MNAKAAYFEATKAYQKGQYVPALQVLNKLLDVSSDPKNYVLLAKTLIKLNMPAEAAISYEKAAETGARRADEYLVRAMELYLEAGEDDKALLASRGLVEKAHHDPAIAYVLTTIFNRRGQDELVASLRKPLIESGDIRHLNLAIRVMGRDANNQGDLLTFANALKKAPKRHDLRFGYQHLLRKICDFAELRATSAPIAAQLRSGDPQLYSREGAWAGILWCGDERLNGLSRKGIPPLPPSVTQKRRAMAHEWGREKIRIGYLSCDFWDRHATMKLLADVLRRHDRTRFEVILFCHTSAELVAANKADRSAWGEVVEVGHLSDTDIAAEIRGRGIDILVDLKGHTKDTRAHILNHGGAPIQVAWLGFPGSTYEIDLDYVIGDPLVLPDSSKPFYHEKFCRLPDSYQPNDPFSRPFPKPVTRRSVGLPDDAFVFASFNQPHKITAEMVAHWSNILQRVPDSVLWLMTKGRDTKGNLIREFASHGIAAERVVFAEMVDYEPHINRVGCADLALDTFPCNGHTTTSDVLWGGLPVLTVKGTHFASRVSESLLTGIGLGELIAQDAPSYIDMAVAIATDRPRATQLKARLEDARLTAPLFDSARFCAHLEAAYETMVERAKAGLGPDHFDVPAMPLREGPFARLDEDGSVVSLGDA